MSRGFVKEGDQEETPIIPPRAALPPGVINYVTPQGMDQLLMEREDLERERAALSEMNDTEKRRALAVLNGKLDLLQERILTARILDPANQPPDEIRFGAIVTYRLANSPKQNTIQIVGVDEAAIKQKKIAFVAPIAMALNGHKKGDVVDLKLGQEIRKIEIIDFRYE